MLLIAHRGNTNGENKNDENKEEYLINAINRGFDVELDIRLIDNTLYLGHDKPQYKTNIDFLLKYSHKMWIHCKNIEAFDLLIKYPELNCFWHDKDNYTLTTKKYIWAYPSKQTTSSCICVMPEWNNFIINDCLGVCSDFVEKIKIELTHFDKN